DAFLAEQATFEHDGLAISFELRAFALQVPPQQDQHADGHGDQQHGKDEAKRVAAKHRGVFGVRGVGHGRILVWAWGKLGAGYGLGTGTDKRTYPRSGSSFSVTVSQSSTTP